MLDKMFTILKSYINAGDKLVLGVSGGPDSTALLHILAEFSKRTPCGLIIAHINHGIRGKEALRDEKFVRNLAASFGFSCEVKRVRLIGSSLEARGREIRRTFFEYLRKKYKARYILTAHTSDDQLETILFNFLRGSGPKGLAGMETICGPYFKPFLNVSKSEILVYLRARKLQFCIDRTNTDTQYRRNFLRQNIVPLLPKINPGYKETLLRESQIFRSLANWTSREAQKFLDQFIKGESSKLLFPLKAYRVLPEALKTAVIQESYRRSKNTLRGLSYIKVHEISQMLERNIGNKRISCGGGGTFILSKGLVRFED